MLLQYITNKIKKLDKNIQIIKLLQTNKLEDIQLNKDLKVKSKIIYQTNHKIKDLDTNNVITKIDINKLAKDKDQKWAQN